MADAAQVAADIVAGAADIDLLDQLAEALTVKAAEYPGDAPHTRPKYRPRPRTTHFILHDTHTEADVATVPWLRWEGRQRGLLDIGYHYLIYPDGMVVQTRDVGVMGSHTPAFNHCSIGVALVGGMLNGKPHNTFGGQQRVALFALYAECTSRYAALELRGHTELMRLIGKDRGRPCPCLNMDVLRDQLLQWLADERTRRDASA